MKSNLKALDQPEILASLFHPRPEIGPVPAADSISDHLIPVDHDVHIGARFHAGSKTGANLLFFHGNGEIAADYDELGPIFGRLGINLLAVDYRGYGRSSGHPSVSTMMTDCHVILDYVLEWLNRNNYAGPLIVMGRSLGSASALELAAQHKEAVNGLIIESGFAYAVPLLRLLGVDLDSVSFKEEDGFVNLAKIQTYPGPTLIIHAEFDHIIPYSDGLALYKSSTAEDKSLLKIEGANHNDILVRGFDSYMQAIQRMILRITGS